MSQFEIIHLRRFQIHEVNQSKVKFETKIRTYYEVVREITKRYKLHDILICMINY